MYDRVLRYVKIIKKKSDTLWDININTSAHSMKGILMLFEDPDRTDTESYYNPKIEKVEITIEGKPNQLCSLYSCMRAYQHWDEINKYFALTSKRNKETEIVARDLCFTNLSIRTYLTKSYALWLDLRSCDDNSLHGSGRTIGNSSTGITILINKKI